MLSKVTLAGTDLAVSQLCYGTNMLGWQLDQDASDAILDHFVSLGGNFIDTARMYGDWVPDIPAGASERAIGAWLRKRDRTSIVVATKGGAKDVRAGDGRDRMTPADIEQDLGESLDHLGVRTIDLYWVHVDNPEAPVEPIVDTLLKQQASGNIRYFGASNWHADRIRKANAYAKSIGKQGFVAAQPFWGLAVPNVEGANRQGYLMHYEGHMPSLHAEGMPMIPYAGQSGGYFVKVDQGGVESLSGALKARYDHEANAPRLQAARALAAKHGVSINEIALAYLLDQPFQTIPIIGASRAEQLDASVKATKIELSADELAQLRAES